MKSLKVISYPKHTPKSEEVDLYFRIKRGQLISNNQESDIKRVEEVKQHIAAEVENYFNQVGEMLEIGLIIEIEKADGSRTKIKYIEDIEDEVYQKFKS